MIDRRCFILAAPLAALAAGASAQAGGVTLDELRREFESRPASTRRGVQNSLKLSGYYTGALDGAWGPATANAFRALMASARYRRHAPHWTWARHVQVIETLFFLDSDAYL
ncbi:hypothetical protein [Marinovum sp.]|uniref:peptidoglycan-binding domain-containing protein n=1 Tax=Marinovum sp. TaxID=2024839 RepID=UPI002B272CFF|nr:hypothetical protein [Marinovum sp.]